MLELRNRVTLEIQSQADLKPRERRRVIGAALDADAAFRPERMGLRDPARDPIESAEAHLADWEPPQKRGKRDEQFLLRVSEPDSGGSLMVSFSPWPKTLFVGFNADWFSEPERLERFAAWFLALNEAMCAYYGRAALSPVLRQEQKLREVARRAETIHFDRSTRPYFVEEHAIPDVYWLNYFGPATVAKWGADRLTGVGIRQQATPWGGRLVWATNTPFVHDPDATSMTACSWKQPFYEALGVDTFLHENWRDPGPGVCVPTFDEHRSVSCHGDSAGVR